MVNYHQSVADATKRAYLQSASITSFMGAISRVITQIVVEDSPDSQKLLDEANVDLDQALKQVESAQKKLLEATRNVKHQDAKLAALVGHMAETVEQVIEHEDYSANVATIAGGAEVYIRYDAEFATRVLSEADEPVVKTALGRLDRTRLDFIKQAIEREEAKREKPVDPLDPDLRTVL